MMKALFAKLYRKALRRFRGMPVLIVIYKPWMKDKNVEFTSILPFDSDPYLVERFQEIAERVRLNWQKQMEEVMDD